VKRVGKKEVDKTEMEKIVGIRKILLLGQESRSVGGGGSCISWAP
jgi:hypothetical protein